MSERNVEIVALVGSLRRESINRGLAQLAADKAPAGITVTVVDGLGRLAFYSEDDAPSIESGATLPDGVTGLREAVAAADAVLLVTPEYNGTMPAVLKNAIDWLSRPYGAGALSGKPVGVIGAALGRFAGTWSREDTRKSVKIAGGHVVEEVEFGLQTSSMSDDGLADAELVTGVVDAVRRLADEVSVSV